MFWLLVFYTAAGCSSQVEKRALPTELNDTSAKIENYQPEFIDDHRLHNAYRLHEKIISGGAPDEDSMQALKQLGVKTIISVDGARPDVELAKKYGMRYVHLPHGYDGIPKQRATELAKAVRDLDGPIFIHCHHGKHRSPASAATACIAAGLLRPEDGLAVLNSAGTNTGYRGLFQSVQNARPLGDDVLNTLHIEFKETVEVPPLAEAMVALEKTHDRLKILSENQWRLGSGQSHLDSAHEALLLREHFTEMPRTDEVQKQSAEFQSLLSDSERAAQSLDADLTEFARQSENLDPPPSIRVAFDAISKNCKACHQKFRDIPIHEKQLSR